MNKQYLINLDKSPVGQSVLLRDGQSYDLGACSGTYKAEHDIFSLGNCFVPRSDTKWSGERRELNNGELSACVMK